MQVVSNEKCSTVVGGNGNDLSPCGENGVSCGDGGGGGGKVICTELCRNGAIEQDVWMADIR